MALATDLVVFTLREQALQVLLRRRETEPHAGDWALPGARLCGAESLEACAVRVLAEQTGLRRTYLEQLYTFGAPDRDPRGRVVSVAYYALLPPPRLADVEGVGGALQWCPVERLPALAFDHGAIIGLAHHRLAAKLEYSTIALQFMGETFTLSELQRAHEIILGEPLDKRNFRKRLRNLTAIEATGEWFRAGNHRPARLFRVARPGRVEFIK